MNADFRTWALNEPVEVTCLNDTDDGIFLVARTSAPGAVVLSFGVDGVMRANGVAVDLGDDLMAYCSLIDDAYDGYGPFVGAAVVTRPYSG